MAQQGKVKLPRQAVWELGEWNCFIVLAWMVINLSVGSRKGESTKLEGDVDENDWFNREAVTFCIGGRTYVDPPEAALRAMAEGDHSALAPKGSKCDQWGTMHGTEPIILPYHQEPLNAAKWLRDVELRWPAHGKQRKELPLFTNKQGLPFKDATFATMVMTAVEAAVGEARAKLFSPHSWRVWLATALRMCNASDARIQAMGRWLNPESIKIYARMTKGEYSEWVDKLMAVKRIDTARTTNMPIMDAADAIAAWGSQLHEPVTGRLELWNDDPVAARAGGQVGPALKRHARISVYWTEMDQWFNGTCKCSRIEDADGGGKQRASCVVYDASGPWAGCKASQLTYWHCLDDEQWQALAE